MMNFLAHAYLSFGDPGLLAGNMISDFVKGRKQYDYPMAIQKGIRLHRAIDIFTDAHPIVQDMKKFFAEAYGLYAGALVDVACDHLLATEPAIFPAEEELKNFSQETYQLMDQQHGLLPVNFIEIYRYMKQFDWLYNYRFIPGIEKSFHGISRRAKYMKEADTAFRIFLNNKETMRQLFREFFPLLKNYSMQTALELGQTH